MEVLRNERINKKKRIQTKELLYGLFTCCRWLKSHVKRVIINFQTEYFKRKKKNNNSLHTHTHTCSNQRKKCCAAHTRWCKKQIEFSIYTLKSLCVPETERETWTTCRVDNVGCFLNDDRSFCETNHFDIVSLFLVCVCASECVFFILGFNIFMRTSAVNEHFWIEDFVGLFSEMFNKFCICCVEVTVILLFFFQSH